MTDPTYAALVAQNADLRDQVERLTKERDELRDQRDAADYDKSFERRLFRLGRGAK